MKPDEGEEEGEGGKREQIERLSQEFYSLIPHQLGKDKAQVRKAIIDNMDLFVEKQNLLQLMQDIIHVHLSASFSPLSLIFCTGE